MVFSADTAAMLKECGLAASCGGVATYGILDRPEEILQAESGAGVIGKMYRFLFQSSAWPSVEVGSTVTIGGANYTVRERTALDDGEMSALLLSE